MHYLSRTMTNACWVRTVSHGKLLSVPLTSNQRHQPPITHIDFNQRSFSTSLASIGDSYLSVLTAVFKTVSTLPPTVFIQDQLCYLHDNFGFSWWACITVAALGLRIGTVPAQIVSQKTIAKRVLLKEEMDQVLVPALQRATDQEVMRHGWSKEKADFYFQRGVSQIYSSKVIEYNCATSKIFLPIFLQVPIFVFTTAAIRNLVLMRTTPESVDALQRLNELAAGGCLWFPNLAIPDATLALSVLVTLAFLSGTEISTLQYQGKIQLSKNAARHQKIRKVLWRLVAVGMGVVSSQIPSAISFYWFLSGSSAVFFNLIFMSPKLKRFVRIPKLKTEEEKPYRKLVENLQQNILNLTKSKK